MIYMHFPYTALVARKLKTLQFLAFPSSLVISNIPDIVLHMRYSYGFGAYFNILPGSEWSALMLTYGFPLSIIGMALKVNH